MHQYLLFYKPYGVLSQFSDQQGRLTLRDYVPVPDVYPVGRLDRDSEGLLLLTNHGWLQHRLSDPQFAHPRTYWVQVEGLPAPHNLASLEQGLKIKNYMTRPAAAKLLAESPNLPPREPPIRVRQTIPTAWLEITLTEGRNRQVRRMTAAIGFPTLRLVRAAIGPLSLGSLVPGEWKNIEPQTIDRLRHQLKSSRSEPLG